MPIELTPSLQAARWSAERIEQWYDGLPLLLGANYLPSSAINQLEMFQADTFDADLNRRELSWAVDAGMNSMRVFLHDLLWEADANGFKQRLDTFLGICAEVGIRPCLVFFDDCHRPHPKAGRQPEPIPGIHNSGWAQSPGIDALYDERHWPRLERYVTDVLETFGQDERIVFWDLFNEPTNGGFDGNEDKAPQSAKLTQAVFEWARAVNPTQPLTICVWRKPDPLLIEDSASLTERERLILAIQQFCLDASDLTTFHDYGPADPFREKIQRLKTLGRPVVCTEYMARTQNSCFQTHAPVLAAEGVGGYNWGLVTGKSGTIFPWGSPEGAPEPELWFHDVFRRDGTPFDRAEIEALKAARAHT
ncbi:MAG: cellulase family glycosylhydrolase [Opitutales bacterium]